MQTDMPVALFYSSDSEPGITRLRKGNGFAYRDAQGRWIRDPEQLARIRKLAVPPAYTSVWICPSPDGHLQATGRDARSRKQYRYHELWRAERDTGKFDRTLCASGEPFTQKQVLAEVSAILGNTPAVCRKAYVHPAVLALCAQQTGGNIGEAPPARPVRGLVAAEQRLVAFLRRATRKPRPARGARKKAAYPTPGARRGFYG